MKAFVLSLIWILALLLPARAVPAHKLVAMGNHAYEAGNFDEAMSRYDEASVDAPEAAPVWFNKGAVHYRKERYEDAAKAFQEAAVRAKDPKLAAQAKFNLGDCSFRQAERQRDSDLGKAITCCRTSIEHYQEALRLDPKFQYAAENIEVVRLYIKTLLDEQKKQQEQQQSPKDQQKQQDQQQDQQKDQQQGQQQQGQQQQNQQPQKGDEQQQADQQKKDQQSGKDGSQQQQQQTAGKEQEKEQKSSQGKDQQTAAMQASQDTANDILNEEKENRQRMQAMPVGKGRPVEKDW